MKQTTRSKLIWLVLAIGLFTSLALKGVAGKAQPQSGGGVTSPWILYNWNSQGHYVPANAFGSGGDLSTFSFPLSGRNVAYPTFLLTQTNVVGNLTGKTLTCTFTISATGSPQFVWGGDLSGWNTCCLPANARFFISDQVGYSNPAYTACPGCFWWSDNVWAQISATTGTVTISATFDPAVWSDAGGVIGSNDLADFNYTVAHVVQIGVAFSGGSFFDVGVAILNGTGSGWFHLNSFTAQ